jgi:prephenate dehydrogenase
LKRRTVGIFGVGAIGGSIALRARRGGATVIGFDRDAAALAQARRLGAIDAVTEAEEASRDVDILFTAAHLEPTLKEIERLQIAPGTRANLIVDVASVKLPVVRAAARLRNFVATHPIAGTEQSGAGAARADLFEDRPWVYVRSGDEELDERARGFIESMGAVPLEMAADEHDRAVALTSHLPQVVASCYATILRAADDDAKRLAGPVARELLRIAGMSFDMWRDILRANAANIEPHLRCLAAELQTAAAALARDDVESLASLFTR